MSQTPRSGKSVLVVDDEVDILHLVSRTLEKWGYKIAAFAHPAEALYEFEQAYKKGEKFDLLLTDVRMPNMSGIELGTRARKIDPDLKILLMTAFEITSLDTRTGFPVLGHDELLKKPFALKDVCNAVNKHLKVSNST